MKEIIALNDWLLKHPADLFVKDDVYLDRGDPDGELNQFPSDCRVKIEMLCREIENRIPSDFNYVLCLGIGSPALLVPYGSNWDTTETCHPYWDRTRSIFKQLEETDWNAVRQEAIRQSLRPDREKMERDSLAKAILEEACKP